MAATLRVTHKAIGVEVRRGTYDVVVDSDRAGTLELNAERHRERLCVSVADNGTGFPPDFDLELTARASRESGLA